MSSRRLVPLSALAVAYGVATVASAQVANNFNCVASVANPPLLRAEGLTELTGDVVLNCSGGPTSGSTTVNVQIFLNTNITSRILGNATEALLLVNDPAPGAQVLGTNIFQGSLVAANSVAFPGVILPAIPSASSITLRITNVRANLSALGAASASAPPNPVLEVISISSGVTLSNPNQTVGFIVSSTPPAGTAPFLQCSSVSNSSAAFMVNFGEAFPNAFKLQGGGVPTAVPGSVNQTESGLIPVTSIVALRGAGQADFATRVQLTFTGIGSGVNLLVPTTLPANGVIGSTAKAVLVPSSTQLTTPGSTPSPLVAATTSMGGNPYAQLTGTGGVFTATYEIIATNSSAIENFAVPVFFSFPASSGAPPLGTVAAGFAPASTAITAANSTVPIPRFAGTPFSTGTFDTSGCPASITAAAGTPQAATVGNAFAIPLQATVRDAGNNPVFGVPVTFTAPTSGPSGTFAGDGNTGTAQTDASGVATAPVFTANNTAGTYAVTATVAGVASLATFSLTNVPIVPPPAITSLNPASATVGGPTFTLTINGTGFLPTSAVQFSGGSGSATLIPAVNQAGTQLSVTVGANLIAQPGQASVTVLNGPLSSNAVPFQVNASAAITSLTPNTATAGASDFPLIVTGTNFAAGATVSFNGQPLTPSSSSSTQLIVTVPHALVASAGPVNVTVTSAGVTSAPAIFNITPANTGAATAGNIIITGHDDDYHASSATLQNGDTPSPSAKAQLAAIVKFARAAAPNPALPVLIFDPGPQLQEVLTSLGVPFVNVDPGAGIPNPNLFDTTLYSAIGVASSCNTCDNNDTTTASLSTPQARASFQSFVAAGGGIFAFASAGTNNFYTFLPKAVVRFNFFQNSGFQSTAVGNRLGIPAPQGDFAHNIFPQPGTGGVNPEWEVVENYTGSTPPSPVTLAIEGVRITTGCPLPSGTVNVAYPALTLTEIGLSANVTWSGTLPQGLSVSPAGVVSGIPSAPGSTSFTLSVTDGLRSTAKSCSITINNALNLTGICPASVPPGVAISIPLTASGGDGNYTLAYTSGPTWLALLSSTGIAGSGGTFTTALAGTPPGPGVFPFIVTLMDSSGTPVARFSCSVTVLPVLTLTGSCPATSIPAGAPFSLPLSVSGGSGTYQFSLAGAAWLALSANAGTAGSNGAFTLTLSGTPPASGTYAFTVTVRDNANSIPKTFACSIIVASPLQLSGVCPATPIPQGVPFTLALAASGGNGNYRLTSSSQAWLVLSSSSGTAVNGTFQTALSGVPPTSGSFPFVVTLSDTGGSAPVSLSCGNFAVLPPLAISGACPAPAGTQNAAYFLPFSVSGGNGNYRLSSFTPVLSLTATAGVAPAGGAFNDALTGTFTAPGIYSVSVQASDTAGSRPAVYTCNVAINQPQITVTISSGCPAASVVQGTSYAQQLQASGGDGTFLWSLAGGSLPAGLTLSGNTISGTPTAQPGKFPFTLQVTSAGVSNQVSCSITVAPTPLHLTTGCPGDGVQGSPYGPVLLGATGGLGAGNYSFAVIGGGLPAGLALANNAIAGTPTGPPGTSTFQLQVTSGTQTDTTGPCSLKITPPTAGQLQLSGVCPATPFTRGLPVSLSVTASGGKAPYTYALTSGPSWLSVANNGSAAAISGTATDVGDFNISVRVTDSAQTQATYSCSIHVNPGVLQISAACPGSATAGSTFTTMLTASGGGPSYSWSLSGPPWMTLTATTGANISLTGIPPAAGSFPFTVTLSDGSGSAPVTFTCTLLVNPPVLRISSTTGCPTSPIDMGASVAIALSGSGGQTPYSWTLNGPSWLSLSAATGTDILLTGKAPPPAGTVSLTVSLGDSAGSGTASFTCNLAINPAVIPPVTITGLTATPKLTDPLSVSVGLSAATPVVIEGDLQLTFTPNAFGLTNNPQVTFLDPRATNGGRLLHFQVPAGTQTIPVINIMQGTVAGTIRVEVISLRDGDRDVLPANHPVSELVVPRSPPVITGDLIFDNERANGFDVLISGYSTPRDMASVELTFTPAQDAAIDGSTTFTVPLTDLFNSFYQSAASAVGGSTFANLRIPVTVDGDKTVIGSVTVTLINSAGRSAAITKNR